MKRILTIISIVAFISCGKNDPATQLENINGYWEIKKVELEKDSVMEYGLSQYIDYIEIADSTGFRKKLQPKFGGGYIATNDAEKVTARIEDNKLILYYSTPFDNWKEEVLKANGEELVVINSDDKIYYYQKYTPLLTENDEKEKE
ncbi:lipocalin family protein [Christiangramia crocea]|uniref:Lipocalin-like domain-containing protein n=1 Tax=Christiangramia crocea TaxID=2904124 RepID=A0A9X1UZ87_9FLAO|nr:lipocalin family protein [Gramella crocea]MCG9973147.1 hypothetical protein [Gramella crocea]